MPWWEGYLSGRSPNHADCATLRSCMRERLDASSSGTTKHMHAFKLTLG